MDSSGSDLSSAKYGYDFVVATTQTSINSDLFEFLCSTDMPVNSFCWLADEDGNPTIQKTLDEVISESGGVNPFDIPDGTDTQDDRIKALYEIRFFTGVQLQVGVPPGVDPRSLPPILDLGDDAEKVQFNMFCAKFTVIELQTGYGEGWHVYNPDPGTSWYVQVLVDLKMCDLDKELDTPYFNNHPDLKQDLLSQLENLSDTAFSLQQLLVDLTNSYLGTLPTFPNIPAGSGALDVLNNCFLQMYSKSVDENGLPILSVVANIDDRSPDASQLRLTSFDRQVNPPRDKSGQEIKDPTDAQRDTATLDHLCAIDNHAWPGLSSFTWNWVLPEDVNSMSGIISLNRNLLAQAIHDQLEDQVLSCCIRPVPSIHVHAWKPIPDWGIELYSNQSPDVDEITKEGNPTVKWSYTCTRNSSDSSGLSSGQFNVDDEYTCEVSFKDTNTIVVDQYFHFHMYAESDHTGDSLTIMNKTITDTYSIAVTDSGSLKLKLEDTTSNDTADPTDINGFINFFTGINDAIDKVQDSLQSVVETTLRPTTLDGLQNFIFPGGKVFTYKSPTFSDHQDLNCSITYVDPGSVAQKKFEKQVQEQAQKQVQNKAVLTEGSSGILTHSTSLMLNHVQGEIVSPRKKFQALQMTDGHAMLYAIDTDGLFHAILEQSGTSSTGWQLYDLSTKLIQATFPGATDGTVQTFDVAQSVVDGSISMMVVISSAGSDELFISLQNSNQDPSWASDPTWTHMPFDAVSETIDGLRISGTYFAEVYSPQQYLIVDLDRSESGSTPEITRYYVDPTKSSGRYWMKHDVPVDIEADDYESCVGQVARGRVDGIYTRGSVDSVSQLVYQPVANASGGMGPPAPRRLVVPNSSQGLTSIATARESDSTSPLYNTTDLYAIADDTLYRWPSDAQNDGSTGRELITNSTLLGTSPLRAMTHDGVTTLWGKNASGDVYYLSCATDTLDDPDQWSIPVPILTGIEQMTAYTNMADGGNIIFASGGGQLFMISQATNTSAKTWKAQTIKLAVPPEEKPISFKSWTTNIRVTDAPNGLPSEAVSLALATDSRTPVYLNGIYYLLGPTPVEVETDSRGSLTVVEETEDINAAVLTVWMNGDSTGTVINRMDGPFQQVSSLNSIDALREASFPSDTVAGGVLGSLSSTRLVDPSTSDKDLNTIASRIDTLGTVYGNQTPTQPRPRRAMRVPPSKRVVPSTRFRSSPQFGDPWDDIAIAAGDLFSWLKTGVEAVIGLVEDAATATWHFIATIGEQVYRAILDTVDAVVAAVEWVFNAIKTVIEDIIRFVEFLFDWDDIRRAKEVLAIVTRLYVQHQVDSIPAAKSQFDANIAALQKSLSDWAGITDWSSLGDLAGQTASEGSSDPMQGQTASSRFFADQFQNNAANMSLVDGPAVAADSVDELIQALLGALSDEGEVLSEFYLQLQDLASHISDWSVSHLLQGVVAILAEGLLSSAQSVVDSLMDVLQNMAQSGLSLLDSKLHIPVISDILNAIGIPDISFLDLFAWIAAMGYTVVYKLVEGKAPFPDTAEVQTLISASSWEEVAAMFPTVSATAALSHRTAPKNASVALQKVLYIASHSTAGFMLCVADFVTTFEAECPTGDNPFSVASAVLGIFAAASEAAGDLLTPRDPIDNPAVGVIGDITSGAVIVSKLIFSGPAQKLFGASDSKFSGLAVDDGRATGAIVNTVLVVPALFVSGWHFYELSQKPVDERRAAAIIGEVSNLTSYISRVCYAVAVNDPDEESRLVPIVAMAASNLATGGLQTAEAVVH
ncbi:uncharacterized protein BO95DRAFT_505796 [Aspergillus brunneoviolaceus CBS 621.78]|uniref:Uncharacterized protein n=1 Tax=Aspergillus brunneoviolaceus CBS 621.78 TaxID=1450534 RepID=A0ACD1FXW0_9EURO|nr:hypothetical protein BO95DRAFT_505796 [Aspergillus brunneoviolaceus CBS 621.78]RAH41863.1 hypothetical protein BO95DRAFT_505796 [Aspergillus brunneoviolaceus CBS 621.78]